MGRNLIRGLFFCGSFHSLVLKLLPINVEKDELMQAKGFHVLVENDIAAKVHKLCIVVVAVKKRLDVESEFLQNLFTDNTVAVKQIGKQAVARNGLKV
jgi:hypothetical protein